MGWDAYAGDNATRSTVKDKRILKDFERAADEIVREYGHCDGLLPMAGLDFNVCGDCLEMATGQSVFSDEGWSPATVKALNDSAKWDFFLFHPEVVDKACAREFLRLCAKWGLGIWFSW